MEFDVEWGMALETYEHKGFTVEIHADEDAGSPRGYDNLGTLVLFGGGKYDLANEDSTYRTEDFEGWNAMLAHANEKHGGIVVAVRMYDHSSVGLKAVDAGDLVGYPWNCPWDSFWVGMAYVSLAKIVEEYGDTSPESLKTAREVLHAEVEGYSRWLNGEYVGYIVKGLNGEEDSCWGFDDWDYCKEEAEAQIDAILRQNYTPVLPGTVA